MATVGSILGPCRSNRQRRTLATEEISAWLESRPTGGEPPHPEVSK